MIAIELCPRYELTAWIFLVRRICRVTKECAVAHELRAAALILRALA